MKNATVNTNIEKSLSQMFELISKQTAMLTESGKAIIELQNEVLLLKTAPTVKEQTTTETTVQPAKSGKRGARGKKADAPKADAPKAPKFATRKEAIAAWKLKKGYSDVVHTAQSIAFYKISDKGGFLVGNIEEIAKKAIAGNVMNYLVFCSKRLIDGKWFTGYIFSLRRQEAIEKALGVKK